MRKSILVLALTFGIAAPVVADNAPPIADTPVLLAQADPDAGVVIPPPPADPSQPPAPEVKPSDKLHDPLSEPAATYDDLKAAKKQGWSFAILAGIVILTATFARAAARWPSAFGWAAKHKYVIIVTAGAGSVAAAAYNALVLDGSWMAAVLAAGGVLLSLITAKPAEAK